MLKKTITALTFILLTSASVSAQHILNFAMGPSWPKADLVRDNHPKAAWYGSAEWGRVFDKRIIVGAKVDFSWHVVKLTGTFQKYDTSGTGEDSVINTLYTPSSDIRQKNRSFMIPLSAWIGIDPIPQYRFHPVIHAQVGFNSFIHGITHYNVGSETVPEKEVKYYYGFYSKFGLDGMFDLGKQASIFAGFEYQIAPLYHKEDNKLEQISFNAPMIRIGVSFLY